MDVVRLVAAAFFVALFVAAVKSVSDCDPRRRRYAVASLAMAIFAGPAVAWAGLEVRGPLVILGGAILLGAGLSGLMVRFPALSRASAVVAVSSILGFCAVVVVPPSAYDPQLEETARFANWPERVLARGEPTSTVIDFVVDPSVEDVPGIVAETSAGRPDAFVTMARNGDSKRFDRVAADWRRSASGVALVDFAADLSTKNGDRRKIRSVVLSDFAAVDLLKPDDRDVAEPSSLFASLDAARGGESGSLPLRILILDRAIEFPSSAEESADSRPTTLLDGCRRRRIGVVVMPGRQTVRRALDGVVVYQVGPLERWAILRLTIGRTEVKARAIAVNRPKSTVARAFEAGTRTIAKLIVRTGGGGPRFWIGFVFFAAAIAAASEGLTGRRVVRDSTSRRTTAVSRGADQS